MRFHGGKAFEALHTRKQHRQHRQHKQSSLRKYPTHLKSWGWLSSFPCRTSRGTHARRIYFLRPRSSWLLTMEYFLSHALCDEILGRVGNAGAELVEGDVAGLDPPDHLPLRGVAVEIERVRPAERAEKRPRPRQTHGNVKGDTIRHHPSPARATTAAIQRLAIWSRREIERGSVNLATAFSCVRA